MKANTVRIALEQSYDYWLKKNWYYHSWIARLYCSFIPKGSKVLQISCKNGFLLNATEPSLGMGIDEDLACITQAKECYSNYQFYAGNLKSIPVDQKFDYIMISLATMEVDDVQELFEQLHKSCHDTTKIVIDFYSILWEPILWVTQKLSLRRPTVLKNWLSSHDVINFLSLAGFEVITRDRYMIMPKYIPLISWVLNTFIAPLPGINWFCLSQWIVGRPVPVKKNPNDYSVSIIVVCRNERGNVENAVQRCPMMGKSTELIFVEGHSKDNTLEEIRRVQSAYPEKNISWYVQPGKGKGDAVRLGFEKATGDVLMIQDGDLTAPPEELTKFFHALISGKGEFINGSRLVYGMESEAMRILNLIANYCFAMGFSWLLGQPIKDTLCGTKVIFKTDYDKIVKNRSFFGEFDPFGDFDLLFGAAKLNLKIVDVPVHYKNRSYGTSQISRFRHGFLLLCMSFIALRKFKFK
jgi:hypothetical protein